MKNVVFVAALGFLLPCIHAQTPVSYDSIRVCCLNPCNGAILPLNTLEISGSGNGIPNVNWFVQSDDNGCVLIPGNVIPGISNGTITPVLKDTTPLRGLDLYDLALISRHILGLEPLADPFKRIAADANLNGSVTSFDLSEIRKRLLGIYSEWINANEFRFVDTSYVFPNFTNPYPAPPSTGNSTVKNIGFWAVKTGDVNCSESTDSVEIWHNLPFRTLEMRDEYVKNGDLIKVALYPGKSAEWYGLFFNLGIDPEKLKLLDLETGYLSNWNTDGFGVFADHITGLWFAPSPQWIQSSPIVYFKFRILQSGWLHDAIRLREETPYMRSYGYSANAAKMKLKLEFIKPQKSASATSNWSNIRAYPNPSSDAVVLTFDQKETDNACLMLFDAFGRLVWQTEKDLTDAYQELVIPAEAFSENGVYSWRLQSGKWVETGKLWHTKP